MSEAPEPTRILLVDDHPIVRAGLAAIISSQPDMKIVAQTGSGRDALGLYEQLRPDVTLMDLKLPGITGVEAIRELRKRFGDVKVLVLTTYEGDEDIYQALLAGAAAYIIKGMPHEQLLQGIRSVQQGQVYLPAEISRAVRKRTDNDELSVREREVLRLMAGGNSNRAIAEQLGVTEGTVKCHVGVILSRLGVKDRTQAVLIALRRGFVHL
ncbi:two component transcriptional regulator, LuxR family [Bryocella elongata]|uniref:Two component transcriptional regulator, LuxR family n=1 Tax=Bryocella elongata TaxID=863522 RepID=A0A1H5XV69_9BACT|nr:response regulator transcription factor [Bryocella elongata]SEG15553.1 two component transcriptional regulator, LuxR family [Bryocella elongata]